jgi:hypothetical protein
LQQAAVQCRGQAVEQDEHSRHFRRQHAHAAFRRMQAILQRVERQAIAARDRQLAVKHEAVERQNAERIDHIGKIARQRFAGL